MWKMVVIQNGSNVENGSNTKKNVVQWTKIR